MDYSLAYKRFEVSLMSLLNLDKEQAELLSEAIAEFIKDTILEDHESRYYHNRVPD